MSARDLEDIERRLERFIADELLDERYDGRDPLAAGVVDSLALEQLVEHIESEFGVTFDAEEPAMEDFESLSALAAIVNSRQRGRSV